MNREIKFRAWDKEKREMLFVTRIDWHSKKVWFSPLEEDWVSLDHVDLLQYSGLHDCNGKEIYEGDMIEWEKEGEGFGDKPFTVRRKVLFRDGAFYTHKEFSVEENYLPVVAYWGKVVGNAYTPELLETN